MSVQPAHNLSLEEMDKQSFLHPYTPLKDHNESGPTIVASAQGVNITDTKGKEYIDSMAGLWCVPPIGQIGAVRIGSGAASVISDGGQFAAEVAAPPQEVAHRKRVPERVREAGAEQFNRFAGRAGCDDCLGRAVTCGQRPAI